MASVPQPKGNSLQGGSGNSLQSTTKPKAGQKIAPVPFVYPGIGRAFTPAEKKLYPQANPNAPYLQPTVAAPAAAPTAAAAPAYDPVAAAAAQKKAADDARRGQYRQKGNVTLDEMSALYDELMGLVRTTGADQTTRINKNYDGKVNEQVDGMHDGFYDVDVASAAGNLGDSSFRSFDRGKVRKAADTNIKTLNDTRTTDLATLGKQVSGEIARYQADKDGIGSTRQLLNESENVDEVVSTATKLDGTKRGLGANKANYGTEGSFTASANALGNYDTTSLEATMKSVIDNAAASPASKQATITDLLNGTPLDEKKKTELKNKYTQVIG